MLMHARSYLRPTHVNQQDHEMLIVNVNSKSKLK